MISFFELPREIRDHVYEYCLLSKCAVDLNRLRTGVERPRKKHALGIQPSILRTCRQALDEGNKLLYGSNIFYLDIVTFREYYRPIDFNGSLQLMSESQRSCLACQLYENRQPFFLPPAVQPIRASWNHQIRQIRVLQICVQPYTYCQWRQIQRASFFVNRIQCHHTIANGLPPVECLDLLVIRVVKRSVFAETEVSRPENWTSIGYKFQTTESRSWRASSSRDTARDLKSLLRWSKNRAKACIVSQPGRTPYTTTALHGRQSALLRNFLRTGCLVENSNETQGLKDVVPDTITAVLRQSVTSSARRQGDLLVCPSGTTLASKHFNSDSFGDQKAEGYTLRLVEICP